MKRMLPVLFFVFFGMISMSHAQTKIDGKVFDQKDKQKLVNATIMLISTPDSTLKAYTRVDANGNFSLNKPASGNHILIVSYPKYGDFYTDVLPDRNYSNMNIGLTNSATLLQEVIVTGRMPVRINGDTTEFDPAYYKLEKNAKVEDLLKVLPGITVDASGKITAQGKQVKKVLVDGEEFFGDDPTLVTRNLRSDMVDKVQLYEKKSQQAERTGIDDGQREQTINVKLKEDAKNGMFGKALLGGGTNDYYMGQLMLNKFKGSQKISVYGLFGNNNSTQMSWEDAEKFGVDRSVEVNETDATSTVRDVFSGGNVIGIPKAINAGFNFSDKFGGKKHTINANYKFGQLNADGQSETNMSGLINSDDKSHLNTENNQHRVNVKVDMKYDSLNTLLVTGNATKKDLWSKNTRNAQQYNSNMLPQVQQSSTEIADDHVNGMNVSAIYTHKFMKKNRAFSFSGNFSRDEVNGKGSLYSVVKNLVASTDSITDQRKNKESTSNAFGLSTTYTEPVSSMFSLTFGAGISNNTNSSLIESFNKDGQGNYTSLDNRYSNNYNFERTSSNVKIGFVLNKEEKYNINVTNSFNQDKMDQTNNYTQNSLSRKFFTFNPSLNGRISISKNKHFNFNYSGSNGLPSLNQIQPIINNSDLLNRYMGNENLKPSFKNNFRLNYVSFKLLSQSYLYAGVNSTFNNNPIAQNVTVVNNDPNSSTIYNLYVWNNIDGKVNANYNGYVGYHFNLIKSLSLTNGFNGAVSYSDTYNYFNGDLNHLKNTSYSLSYSLVREGNSGFTFESTFTPSYTVMTSSLQQQVNNNGFKFNATGDLNYFLTKSTKVYARVNYTHEAATEAFNKPFDMFLLEPGISQKFFKNQSLMLDLSVYDALNQNKGFSRYASNAIFTQNRFDTLRRYFMVKVSWDFAKMFVKN